MGRSDSGLGMAVILGSVVDHHGYLYIVNELGLMTTFTLYFPVTEEQGKTTHSQLPWGAL